jgi:hypothetical protein
VNNITLFGDWGTKEAETMNNPLPDKITGYTDAYEEVTAVAFKELGSSLNIVMNSPLALSPGLIVKFTGTSPSAEKIGIEEFILAS